MDSMRSLFSLSDTAHLSMTVPFWPASTSAVSEDVAACCRLDAVVATQRPAETSTSAVVLLQTFMVMTWQFVPMRTMPQLGMREPAKARKPMCVALSVTFAGGPEVVEFVVDDVVEFVAWE